MSIKSVDQSRRERQIYIECIFSDNSLKRQRIDYCLRLYSNTRNFRAFINFMDPIHKEMLRLHISNDQHIDTLTCRFGEFSAATIMLLPQELREQISPAFSNGQDTLSEYKSIKSFNEKYKYVKNIFSRTCDLLISYIPPEEIGVLDKDSNRDSIFNRIKRVFFRN
jgi:hypothetical protein